MTDIRRVDLNLLVALDVLLEERNVSRAAERLALTQPTVSGMLRKLRHLFDDPLLVRTQRGMLPTPRADALVAPLKQLLADAEAVLRPQRFDPEAAEGQFVISTTDYMQHAVVVPLIAELRLRAPKLRIVSRPLEVADISRRLASGQIDLAITVPAWAPEGLRSRTLYREEYVCVMGRQNKLALGTLTLARFCAAEHIVVSPTQGGFSGDADAALAKQGLSRTVRVSLANFLPVPSLVKRSDLIALVPRRLVQEPDEQLVVGKPPLEVPGFDVIAVWHPRSHTDPRHHWMRRLLTEVVRGKAKA